jgi:galactonate dehydratase
MKITKLTTYRLPPRWMFLKIETDEGVVGWGEPVIEGRARTVEAAVHELGDYLIGQDPARINDLWQVMYRAGFYRGGPILMSAIAGIDQALWDIKGKVLNAPVWQLMGGLVRDKIKAYSWVGGDRPAEVIDGIKKLRGIGFDTFKLNGCEEMGLIDNSRAVDAAVNTVAQIREAFGNEIEFGLDFHGRVSAPMAKVLIKELEQYRPLFIEEPVLAEQAEYYPRLAAQTSIPIAAGERMFSRFEFKRVLEAGGWLFCNPICRTRAVLPNAIKSPEWPKPTTWRWRRTARWGRSRWPPACTSILSPITPSSRSKAWGFTITRARNCSTL